MAKEKNKYIQKEYNKLAKKYDKRWQGYLKSTHDVALELADIKNNDKILDASGGTGLLVERIVNSKNIKDITILDISEGMLNIAKQRLKNKKNVKFLWGNVHKLNFKSNSFSIVLSISALHYYINPKKAISEFYRVLKPKGSLIIIDWCKDPFHFKIFENIMKTINKSYVKIYTLNELKHLLISERFKIKKSLKWSYQLWSLMGIKADKK